MFGVEAQQTTDILFLFLLIDLHKFAIKVEIKKTAVYVVVVSPAVVVLKAAHEHVAIKTP